MRVPNASRTAGTGVNMTPMIDVVFQLIVFFTATSTIAKSEFGQKVELPVAEKGRDREETTQKKRVTANVLSNGDVFAGGRQVSPESFRDILNAELKQHAAADIEVQFRADREVQYGIVEPLLLACARSGIWQVSFAVKPQERK
jgi:biopolymer transport protein ExbD